MMGFSGLQAIEMEEEKSAVIRCYEIITEGMSTTIV